MKERTDIIFKGMCSYCKTEHRVTLTGATRNPGDQLIGCLNCGVGMVLTRAA